MKIITHISNVKPSQTFSYNQQTTISKCVDAIQSEKWYKLLNVEPDEGEVRALYGVPSTLLIRFSFKELADGNTSVTATMSYADGKQTFFDFFGLYEKIVKKIYSKM